MWIKSKKFIAFICLFALTSQVVYGTSNLENKQDNIEEQIKSAEKKLDSAEAEKETLAAEVQLAELESRKALEDLDAINAQVKAVEAELAQAEADLKQAQIERDNQYEGLKDRISFMYEYGDIGYTQVLLDSKNFSDFFKRVEYINTIIKHDKEILDKLEETEKFIGEKVEEITDKKAKVVSLQAQQKAKAQEVQAKEASKQAALKKAEKNIETSQALIDELEKESARIEAMIQEAQRKAAASGSNSGSYTYTGGQLGWPLANYSKISSGYTGRVHPITGKWQAQHAGIDIPAPKGTPVLAAEGGTVISSGYINGYGYTVVVDHGGGLSTLYAHNSALSVKVGQTVTRGQKVAEVGSTGNSTGNHCHFEVRINGKHTNPLPYVGR